MMLKEHIVETLRGDPLHDRRGLLGRLVQQYMVAAEYPGLLDGIQPNCSFTDIWTTATDVVDCHLLMHYFGDQPARSSACAAGV